MRSAWWGIWQEIESLRGDKAGIEACARQQGRIHRLDLAFGGLWCQEHYQGQLQELKKTMVGDVQRLQDFHTYLHICTCILKATCIGLLFYNVRIRLLMQDEVKRHFAQQKAENAREACENLSLFLSRLPPIAWLTSCHAVLAGLQQQITTLKGEKTRLAQSCCGVLCNEDEQTLRSLQQQILGLQRRIQEIEEQALWVRSKTSGESKRHCRHSCSQVGAD